MHKHLRILIALVFCTLVIIPMSVSALAASASFSRAYQTTSSMVSGSLVSLDPAHPGYVQLAQVNNQQNLIGVVVNKDGSLITANPTNTGVQVILSGTADTLVSTINGNIKPGDEIAASPISGVGEKANPGSRIVGIAQLNFSQKSPGAIIHQLRDLSGHLSKVAIGYTAVAVAVSTSPRSGSTVLTSLQGFASAIVGHPTSLVSVILSTVIAIIALVALIALVYGTIRGSLVSIGRNPLAKPAIFQSLTQVLIMSVMLIAFAIIIDYLLLH